MDNDYAAKAEAEAIQVVLLERLEKLETSELENPS